MYDQIDKSPHVVDYNDSPKAARTSSVRSSGTIVRADVDEAFWEFDGTHKESPIRPNAPKNSASRKHASRSAQRNVSEGINPEGIAAQNLHEKHLLTARKVPSSGTHRAKHHDLLELSSDRNHVHADEHHTDTTTDKVESCHASISRAHTPPAQVITQMQSPQGRSPAAHRVLDILAEDGCAMDHLKPKKLVSALAKTSPRKSIAVHNSITAQDVSLDAWQSLEFAEQSLLGLSQERPNSVRAVESSRVNSPLRDTGQLEPIMRTTAKANSGNLTYTQERTFLVDDNVERPFNDEATVRQVNESTDLPSLAAVSVKNVHELRHGGVGKKSLDRLNYLLEGLDQTESMHSTLMELAKAMVEPDFKRIFHATRSDGHLLQREQCYNDAISLTGLLVILLHLSDFSVSSRVLCENKMALLSRALRYPDDINTYVKASQTLSKINKLSAVELRNDLAKSEMFRAIGNVTLSPRLLALMVLAVQEENSSRFVRDGILPILIETKSPRVMAYELQLAASLIEPFSKKGSAFIGLSTFDRLLRTLQAIIDTVAIDLRHNLTCSLLRFCIDVVNIDSQFAARLDSAFLGCIVHHIMTADLEASAQLDDELILCFGLLVCTIEESDSARLAIRDLCREPLWCQALIQ